MRCGSWTPPEQLLSDPSNCEGPGAYKMLPVKGEVVGKNNTFPPELEGRESTQKETTYKEGTFPMCKTDKLIN